MLISEHDTTRNRQVVATRRALYYQGSPRELEPWQRLGWEQVERADWDADRTEITFVHLVPHVAPNLKLRLAATSDFSIWPASGSPRPPCCTCR